MPAPQPAPLSASSPAAPRKVLLIGWDAADWKVIHPLVDAGKMPHLARLIQRGIIGNLATIQPALSPMLWTSVATGKRAWKHGIHGFSEPDPVSGHIRPVTNLSRKTKAIWSILNQSGKHTITIGWWPSNPAEPLSRGVMVSNDFQSNHGPPTPWPLKPHSIQPPRLEPYLKPLRFHPSELTETDLRPFLPGLDGLSRAELDEVEKDPRIQSLMKIIADCTSIHSAATALIQNEPWDLMCVYYDAIDHFGHAFMKYHPPRRPQIDPRDFNLFHHCVEAGYLYHDMMLGTLMALAGSETTVILMSDHGFHPDDLRPNQIPREPAGPAVEHRPFGILAAAGPDLRRDEHIHGASLLDLCPTLLHLFGLPVGEDMDGKVLIDLYDPAIAPPPPIQRIPSWDLVDGDDGMHPPDRQIAPADSKAALDQLAALGYIDEPHPDQTRAREHTLRELDYNLAQAMIDGGLFPDALAILERLYATWPLEHRFGFKLAICYQNLGRGGDLRELVNTLIARRTQEAEEAKAHLQANAPADEQAAAAEQERVAAMSDAERQRHFRERREWIAKSRPNLFSLRYLEASADIAERRFEEALEKLQLLDSDFGARRNALNLRGAVLQRLQRHAEARTAFEEALAIDPEFPQALLGLARTALAQRDFVTAAEHARASLGLHFFQPRAHYLLGMALLRMGHLREAEAALTTCTIQAPLFAAAFRSLSWIARLSGADAIIQRNRHLHYQTSRRRLAEHSAQRQQAPAAKHSATPTRPTPAPRRPFPAPQPFPEVLRAVPADQIVTLVSGLPRSGTSLAMQLLAAAHIPPFTDHRRAPDASNLRGYYEHEKTASLLSQTDRSWLLEARGMAVKVIAPLLPTLTPLLHPSQQPQLHLRVLFIHRDMEEILASQSAMLARLGRPNPSTADIAKAYHQQVEHALTWLHRHQIPTIAVHYHQLVHQPDEALPHLASFLNQPEAIPAMREVIEPSLHRSRGHSISIN